MASIVFAKEEILAVTSYSWPTPQHLREALRIFLAAYLNEPLPAESVPKFGRFVPREREVVEYLLAANPNTGPQVLELLRKQTISERVLIRIASHPRAEMITLRELAGHPLTDVRAAVAEHSSPDVLALVLSDPSPEVRFRLAENFSAPEEILELLSCDENPYVCVRAADTLWRRGAGKAPIEGKFDGRPGLRIVAS